MITVHATLLDPTDSPLRGILLRPLRRVVVNGVVSEQAVDISAATIHLYQTVPAVSEIVPDNTPVPIESSPPDVAIYELPAEISGGAYYANGFVTIDGTQYGWHLDFSL